MNLKINKLFNFQKKIVVITGCNGQVGIKIAKFFYSNNAIVYGLDLSKRNKDKKVKYYQCDITKEIELSKVISKIYENERKINIFINNAAVSFFTSFRSRSYKEFKETILTNLYAPFISIKILEAKSKISHKLKIINIGSIYAFLSPDFSIYSKNDRFSSEVYGASKAGLIQMTKYFANLLSKKNINLNSISPGGILNKKLQKKQFIKNYIKNTPKKRMAVTLDLITSIAFLSSDSSDYITGQNIIIDGGWSLK
jgi:NAD(P)-dependent dehydrogenase (short-subunit alcohol dehydrogenase family)